MTTSRERILAALNHQEPDRVPIDFGGTAITTIMVGPYVKVCAKLGFDPEPIYMAQNTGMRPAICQELLKAFHSDTKALPQLACQWRKDEAYDGTLVMFPQGFKPEKLEDGSQVLRNKAGRITSAMPAGGFFFDKVSYSLADIDEPEGIEQAAEEIKNFDRPTYWDAPDEELTAVAKDLWEQGDKLIMGNFIGHVFQAAQYLRGWSQFMLDLLAKPALAEAILDKLTQAHIEAFDKFNAVAGKYTDVVVICDDLGIQTSLWMSPATYRKIVKPYQARLYRHIKDNWDGFLFLHSDGSIRPIIGDLIEIGVDILNPVQYTAKDMALTDLKQEFGEDITFWGGGFNTQNTMAFGSPKQVREEVKRNLEIMAPGGGYVFASVHNITEGTPAENIIAAYQTAYESGRY